MGSCFSSMYSLAGKTKMNRVLVVIATLYVTRKMYRFMRLRYRQYRIRNAKYKPKIVIIGAGFAGLMHAIKLKELGYDDFIILERHAGVGGTWYTNRYPGCACDIASYLYSYSFEQKHDWSRTFAPQKEILRYIESVAIKYDLYSKIIFNADAYRMVYDEEKYEWTIHYQPFTEQTSSESALNSSVSWCDSADTLTAGILISCVGGLTSTNTKYPYSDNLWKFRGIVCHSGNWNRTYDFTNKINAVIGSGTSAIQVVPSLQPISKKLYVFQRSPTYIYPKINNTISSVTHSLFYYVPFLMYCRRFMIFTLNELLIYPLLKRKNVTFQKRAISVFEKHRDSLIPEDQEFLRKAVTPDSNRYTPGCKRLGISNDFYKALAASNAELIVNRDDDPDGNPIIDFYEKGIVLKDGRKLDVDAIAFCTGYQVSKIESDYDLIGRDGASFKEEFNSDYGPRAYKSVVMNQFPNMFMCLGANSGVGSNSFLLSLEIGCDYIMEMIYLMMTRGYQCVEVRKDVEEEYCKMMDERMKEMIWTQDERSWYKLNGTGRVHALFGFSMCTFWRFLRKPDLSDYHVITQ